MHILNKHALPLAMPSAVAVGLFDGVHKGHMALIRDILQVDGCTSVVYTFDTKPANPDNLFTEREKQSILSVAGVQAYYSRRFDRAFAALSPDDFLKQLTAQFCTKHITVGFDFRFGKDARGDVAFLQQNAERYGYTLHVVLPVTENGEKISSTAIREAVRAGDMMRAAHAMGRFYFIDGCIESGRHIGNQIGFPTANIHAEKLMPARGVYATIVKTENGLYRAVTNVGVKPTVKSDQTVNVETHILDFDQNIYGRPIRVFFIEHQRPEFSFPSLTALKEQIAVDSRMAAEILKDLDVYKPLLMC